MPCIGSPAAAIRDGIERTVNAAGSTVATSAQLQRGRDARVRCRPHRVRRGDRPVAGVLAEVDEDADPIRDTPRGRGDRLVAHAPLDFLGECLREPAHLGKRQLRPDRERARGARWRPRSSDRSAGPARPSPRARPGRSRERVATGRRSSGRGRSAGSPGARSRGRASARCAARCTPRLTTQTRAAALSTIANTVECPLGNRTKISSTYSGWFAGTRFWWKKSPSTPFGIALHVERPPAKVGERELRDARVVRRRGRPWSARPPGRTACPDSRPEPRDGPFALRASIVKMPCWMAIH